MDGVATTNGQIDEAAVAETLQDEVTCGYLPQSPLETMWTAGGDMPQITLRRDIEFMLLHPTVSAALEYYRSGIAGAEFWGGPDPLDSKNEDGKPVSPDPRVAQFVLAHAARFWDRGVPHLQEGYAYGWCPGEHVYKESQGMLVWSHLKAFHPSDGHMLTLDHHPIGVRVKNIRERGEVDMWFASDRIPAKAAWYAHRPRFGQPYGRTQLAGGWRPWRRLGWRDAVEQVIDAAVYRAGYRGPIVRHPKEDIQTAREGVPATRADEAGHPRRSARDVARQLVEWAKAGAGFTLSSEKYPQSAGGDYKWSIEWPEHVMDVSPLIKAAEYLEDQIMLGIGVPPELVKAGGTGSGYSGRSIPREAFLDGQQRIADAMLQMFVEQVIRPLVLWNFGEVPFELCCKSLLKTQTANKQGEPKPPLPQPNADQDQAGGQDASGNSTEPPQTVQPPQSPALSLTPEQRGKVMEVVARVMWARRRAA